MLLDIIRYVRGYLQIRVSGSSVERFLNACSHRGIYLWGLRPVGQAYEMNITIKGFRQLKPVLRKTGTRVVIIKRTGLPFFLHRYRNRKMFFAGAVFCISLLYLFSRFIWGIDISGNKSYTDEILLKYLSSREIKSGMKKSQVDCGRIVKDLRREYGDIIWVSASIQGTKLYIQVKENEDSISTGTKEDETENAMDLVADRDCVIDSITVRKGTVQVKRGEKVKKGTVLVSGQVPVLNDAKEVTGYQYHQADADITGITTLEYEESCEDYYEEKKYESISKKQTGIKEEYTLIFGNYRFTLGNIKSTQKEYEIKGIIRQLCLSDSFSLPVYFGVRKVIPYQSERRKYTKKDQQQILSRQFLKYKEELEKKGVEIIGNDVKIYRGKDCAKAAGHLQVSMPIGESRPSELKEVPRIEEKQQGETIHGDDGGSH